MIQTLWRTVWKLLKKIKIELPHDLAIQLWGMYPENNSKRYMHPNIHCSAIYNSQDMETNYMFIKRRMNKGMVHINNWILLSHKKGTNGVTCRDVDGPRYWDIEWIRSERWKKISYINAYRWNLKNWYRRAYLQNRNRDTDIKNKCVNTKEARGKGEGLWDRDWHIYTLLTLILILCLKQILMRTYCIAQGTLFIALCWLKLGKPKKEVICIYI